MENESAKNDAPIPGNLAYVIAKKTVKKSCFSSVRHYRDTDFADFLWCIKARSRDITRPNITGILIEPAKICATDGLSLHIITNPYPSIPPGEYEVYQVKQSKVILISKTLSGSAFTNNLPFPSWNRSTITMEGVKPEHEITVDRPSYLYIEILKYRIVDIKLLQSAISDESMNVRIYSNTQPVVITTLTRTAIVSSCS